MRNESAQKEKEEKEREREVSEGLEIEGFFSKLHLSNYSKIKKPTPQRSSEEIKRRGGADRDGGGERASREKGSQSSGKKGGKADFLARREM